MYTCIPSHDFYRSWCSCTRQVYCSYRNTLSMHHSESLDMTTCTVAEQSHVNLSPTQWLQEFKLGIKEEDLNQGQNVAVRGKGAHSRTKSMAFGRYCYCWCCCHNVHSFETGLTLKQVWLLEGTVTVDVVAIMYIALKQVWLWNRFGFWRVLLLLTLLPYCSLLWNRFGFWRVLLLLMLLP